MSGFITLAHHLQVTIPPLELAGPDDQIIADRYSKSVTHSLEANLRASGEVLGACLYAGLEAGTGAILASPGKLIFFDTNPALVTSNATSIAAGSSFYESSLGHVTFATTDWLSDGVGGIAYKACAIPFHSLKNIFAVFRLDTGATTINLNASDEEVLRCRFWYRLDRT
jgi:hypothetical protein